MRLFLLSSVISFGVALSALAQPLPRHCRDASRNGQAIIDALKAELPKVRSRLAQAEPVDAIEYFRVVRSVIDAETQFDCYSLAALRDLQGWVPSTRACEEAYLNLAQGLGPIQVTPLSVAALAQWYSLHVALGSRSVCGGLAPHARSRLDEAVLVAVKSVVDAL
jgi:hypothetical protein